MKKIILTILFSMLSLSATANIQKINNFAHIQEYMDDTAIDNQKKLVIFDIDDTTGNCVFNYSFSSLVNPILFPGNAQAHLSFQDRLHFILSLRPTDKKLPSMIQALQAQDIDVIMCTKRPSVLAEQTERQLNEISITPSNILNTADQMLIDLDKNEENPIYKNGVIYCAKPNPKGQTIVQFLKQYNINKEKIAFADDLLEHIESVHLALTDAYPKMQHTSYHYNPTTTA